MKDRKVIAMMGLALSVGMLTAGCAGAVKEEPHTEVKEMNLTDEKQDAHPLENSEKENAPAETEKTDSDESGNGKADSGQPEGERENTGKPEDGKAGNGGAEGTEQDADETESAGQALNRAEGTESLGGKVQGPQEDGMILAQTTLMDEDGMVTLLEVKDAKKIPVKFTADTKVEHWTIQGGGAGIDMQDASFSDLEEGQSVEVEGNFEGETFVATRVIIEEYV